MQDLPASWKLFRIVGVIQLILFAFLLIRHLLLLFSQPNLLLHSVELLTYAGIFWFLFLGQTLLHEHYPDVPLEPVQKRRFNWLFLLSVLGIAFLSGHVINQWTLALEVMREYRVALVDYLPRDPLPLLYSLALLFHIVFITGMYLLRSGIHHRVIQNLQEPFAGQ